MRIITIVNMNFKSFAIFYNDNDNSKENPLLIKTLPKYYI